MAKTFGQRRAVTLFSSSLAHAKGGGRVRIFCHYPQGAAFTPLHWRQMETALEAMLEVLQAAAPRAAEEFQVPAEVELFLLDDAAIADANARHLGCTGPTNILSFPGGADAPGVLLLSLDTLRRECLLYGQDPSEHAVRLLAHGMGHLCGLDHGPAMDALCEGCMDAGCAALCSEGGAEPAEAVSF